MTDANLLLGRLPATLPGGIELDVDAARARPRRHRPRSRRRRRERRDDPRAPRRLRRAGARSARLRARRVRRRRAAARVRARRRARDVDACSSRRRPASSRRSGWSPRTSAATRVRSYVAPLAEAGELPEEGEADLRYAGQSFELTVPLGADARRALPRGARGALRVRRSRARRSSSSRCAPRRCARPRRSTSPARSLAARGPQVLELEGATALGPGRLGGRDGRARHARPAEAGVIAVELQVHRQRRCARSPRRWARCSSARRSRRTSRSGATARPRSSTSDGRMVTQAEHIPVHLGAMPEAVAAVRAHDPAPGEPWILNDPYAGGTHLPDLTIVTRTRARLRGHPRAPRGRRRLRAGKPPAGLDARSPRRASSSRRRGSTTRRSRRSSRGCATRTSGAATSARSSPRTALAERRVERALRAARARTRRGGDGRAPRVLGARRPRGDSRAPGRPLRGAPTSLETAGRAARAPRGGDDRRRRGRDRLRRHGAAARRATSTARSRSRARRASTSSAA